MDNAQDTPDAAPVEETDTLPEASEAESVETEEADESSDEVEATGEETADTEDDPPIEELKKGYLRQQDYTRKAQEVAEQRKAFEAERQQFAQLRDTRIQAADQAIQLAASTLQADFQKVDWNTLAQTDPAEYVRKQHEFNSRQQQLAAAYQTLQQQKAEKDREESQTRQQRLVEQEKALLDAIPAWRDPAKRAAEVSELRSFANRDLGISDDDLEWISTNGTAGMVQALRDAMLYRKVQKQMPKPKPQTAAPPPPQPVKSKAPAARDLESVSMTEFMRMRDAQEKRSGR